MKIITFGCRINTYESAVMQALGAKADKVLVINTCAVTAEAERQGRQAIRKARREYPDWTIVATGCAVQMNPTLYQKMPEVDRVLGNTDKLNAEVLLGKQAYSVSPVTFQPAQCVPQFANDIRAFLQVQQGCDHHCIFCIVSKIRGKSVSVPQREVLHNVRQLVQNGYKEIILTGVDLSSYAFGLPELIDAILEQEPTLARLSLGSVDPACLSKELADVFARQPRLMPHLHLSMQAGDDEVLKKMGRRHNTAQVLDALKLFRKARPDIVFGADFITGFPTETEEMFQNTLAFVQKAGLTLLHVFPYSRREGTAATRLSDVPVAVRKERADRLRHLAKQQKLSYLQTQIGKQDTVLVEKPHEGLNTHFIRTHLKQAALVGELVSVINQGVQNDELVA